MISIRLTERCNMSCEYCFYKDSKYTGGKGNIDIDKLNHFLETVNDTTSYGLTGGEPLLYKDIEQLICSLSKKGRLWIFTNGLLLEKYISLIMENNAIVQVSLDDVRDENSDGHILSAKVMDNLKLFADLGYNANVIISFTISCRNYQRADEIIEYAKKNGFKLSIGMVGYNEEYLPTKQLKSEIIRIYEKAYGSKAVLYKNIVEAAFDNQYKMKSCPVINNNLFIDCDGDIYDCYHSKRKIGSIEENYTSIVDNKNKHHIKECRLFSTACISLI